MVVPAPSSSAPRPPDVAPGHLAGELAVVTRSGMVESRHLGHAVLVAPDGEVAVAVGEPTTTVYPRSAWKPWQAATIRRCGAQHAGRPLDGAALAVTAGSHAATDVHRRLVEQMLDGGGLGVDDLRCPAALPGDDDARGTLVAGGGEATRLAHNCSGKHAGMLLACRAAGWSTETYLDPDHPLQQAIRTDIEASTGGPVAHVGVDGCGAPAFAARLDDVARAAGRLVTEPHGAPVADAMRAHPDLVAGPGRADTDVMRLLDGVVAKSGAEGVQLLVARTGWAVLVKVLDGSARAATVAALALLAHAGIDTSAATAATREIVLGGGRPVGAVRPGSDLPTSSFPPTPSFPPAQEGP